ncbi:MAG TPA: peptide ABC transporter substrate-binding protein [Candidatus Elarobacter sp.]
MRTFLAVAALAALLAGCTKTESASTTTGAAATSSAPTTGAEPARKNSYTIPHTLRIGDTQDFDNLNPHLSTSLILGNLNQLTMAYLVRYDKKNQPMPELATQVPTEENGGISKNGLTITWHLRHGVKWSDGEPFDGDDVVFSTNAVNNPKNNEVGRDGWDQITKVDEPDKFTVVFHLKKPYAGYLPSFFASAGANPCILPKHILGSLPDINNAPYNSKPVGIGPFRYVEWVRGDHITLEANPYYWRGLPKIKKVIYKVIPDRNTLLTQVQTGEVDLWTFAPSAYFGRLKALSNVAYIRQPSYLYAHIDFNTSHPALHELAVRHALKLAIDRRALVTKINHGIGILQESMVTPASPFSQDVHVPFEETSIAKANQILDAAGWKRGADGIRAKNGVKLNLDFGVYAGSPDTDSRIELLRANWSKIGVAITVKHYNTALFFQLTGGILYGGKWDVTLFSWQLTPDADLNPENSCTLIPPNGQNVTRLCIPELQPLLEKQKVTYSVEARKKLIAQEVPLIVRNVPYVVAYISEDIYVFNRDLTGWHPNNTTPFDDFMNVDI